jgi:glycerate kinase
MNCPAGTEKPHSWKAMNETANPLGARHGLVARYLPLHSGGEWRKLARLDETEELFAGHIGTRLVRHRGCGVSGGLGAQEAATLQMQESTESGMRAREEEGNGKQSP